MKVFGAMASPSGCSLSLSASMCLCVMAVVPGKWFTNAPWGRLARCGPVGEAQPQKSRHDLTSRVCANSPSCSSTRARSDRAGSAPSCCCDLCRKYNSVGRGVTSSASSASSQMDAFAVSVSSEDKSRPRAVATSWRYAHASPYEHLPLAKFQHGRPDRRRPPFSDDAPVCLAGSGGRNGPAMRL